MITHLSFIHLWNRLYIESYRDTFCCNIVTQSNSCKIVESNSSHAENARFTACRLESRSYEMCARSNVRTTRKRKRKRKKKKSIYYIEKKIFVMIVLICSITVCRIAVCMYISGIFILPSNAFLVCVRLLART